MAKIKISDTNLFDLPHGATVRKNNSVYINSSSYRVIPTDGRKPYTSHKTICIGKIKKDENGNNTSQLYANENYYRIYEHQKLPTINERIEFIIVGPRIAINKIIEEYGLKSILIEVFGEKNAYLILDLSMYMLIKHSAVFQHFPIWGLHYALFSESVVSDSYISKFLNTSLSHSKINLFKLLWAQKHIGSGKVFFCYDSTNVNSQAQGIYIVQKGYAKDDKTLEQVNTDYIIRQEDGLPLTFTEYPGSIVDISEASEMFKFLKQITEKLTFKIILICDRGYISEENLFLMDENNIGFLLLLKANLKDYKDILNEYKNELKYNFKYYNEDVKEFGMTIERKIFGHGPIRYFHLLWSSKLAAEEEYSIGKNVINKEKLIQNIINREKKLTKKEITDLSKWFDLEYIESGTLKSSENKEIPAYTIKSYVRNDAAIKKDFEECGFYILVSSEKMTAFEAKESYLKRDCVEKIFKALKSSLGLDKFGIHSDNSLIAKSLIWFVASILYTILFIKSSELRQNDKKNYTLPAIIEHLNSIVADLNLISSKYMRRYKFNKYQKAIAGAFNFSEKDVDQFIESL